MVCGFKTKEYELEYLEDTCGSSVRWESHCHGQYEMIAVLEGDISIMLEEKSYRLTGGQTIIIPPLCYHSVTVNGGSDYRRITVLFDLSAIPRVLWEEFSKKGDNIAIPFSSDAEILREICQSEDPSYYIPLVQSLMIQLFYCALKSTVSTVESKTDVFLRNAVTYIEGHLREKILLEDLARHTARSKSSFCHLFEEKMKISPKQYILQKKLALANKLIGEGTLPTVAASQVGYDNYSNFYRIYHKHFGTCPTKRKD